MTSFIRLCDEIIALHEQNEPAPAPSLPVGAQVAKEFLEKAPQVVVELVNRYFTEVMRTAERAASDKGTRYSDEKFIQNYIDPLAVEHNIDSLPSNFSPDNLREFIKYLHTVISKSTEEKEATNLFKNVSSDILNAVYPGRVKKYDRTNYPGGDKALEAIYAGFGLDKIKEIESKYRLERTHPLDEAGNKNTTFLFLTKYVFPLLKQLNWPIRDVNYALSPAGQKWSSVYLRDFLTAASNYTRTPYEQATGWKGNAELPYAEKQKLRELLRIS